MYKNLRIQNFQSHEDSFLEFDSNLTAVVGLNNHGKSAILKALQKIVRNNPEGNSFIRNLPTQQEQTIITLETDSGIIRREITTRGKDSGKYIIVADNINSTEDIEFIKFSKTGIPQEVLNTLNTSLPQTFDKTTFDLNFQTQLSSLFLVVGDGLASTRSKILSKVTGVDKVQRAIQLGKTKEANSKQEIEKIRKQIQQIQLDLQKYEILDQLEEEVNYHIQLGNELQEQEQTVEYYKNALQRLQNILVNARELTQRVKKLKIEVDLDSIKQSNILLGKIKKLQEIEIKIGELKRIKEIQVNIDLDEIRDLVKLKDNYETLVLIEERKLELENIVQIELPNLEEIKELIDRRNIIENYQIDINNCIIDMVNIDERMETLNADYDKAYKELHKYEDELGICPLCGKQF